MRVNMLSIKLIISFLFLFQFVFFQVKDHQVQAFTNQVIQRGATGEDVVELQARLQYIGFYNGKIDGVFDWKTYWALRNFQYEFGLPIDGLAGSNTKAKLAKATKYDRKFVNSNIDKGNKFSHYGGVDLNKQSGPTQQKATPQPKAPAPAQPKTQTAPPQKAPAPAQPKTQAAPQPKAQVPVQPKTQAAPPAKTQAPAQPKTQAAPPAKAPAPAQPKTQAAPPAKQQQAPKPTATNTPNGFSQNDIKLLANAVYGESRGEPYIGQVAVAAVILNRVQSASFPNTVSGVIFEPGAFTAVADGQIWLTPNEQAKKAVIDAINGYDPTGEAIYYFNPATATNGWIWSRPQIKKIGKHIFCK
ncbi:spore cortex-lytic enzyme [Bacillus sp. DNRA2]|uniref:cell wall hydrolase n=1 Tax=Bacillus sp. DNRA2 TaxID=2723053 RepID=UPI00145C9F17|nr:cell wall hydrolase [Bacillus sp. DNRA2]NMD70297.1 spore cortex-lytic enzyme [Bacillus sp. DNRA2]